MTQTTPQRDFAIQVVRQLRDAGHEALWAGGCVRDALLEKIPKDYDVATNATPDRVREVFGKKRTISIGAAFGVITVLGPKQAGQIEVATFRTEGGYSDGRRPDAVEFSTAEEDASRRDFTINGLFFDPLDEAVIDYVGGQKDLQAKLVRAIGVADERFAEDRLRMLRAVRFAASLGFELDSTTGDAIRRHADAITEVSPERIGAEVKRMLTESDPPRALRLLETTKLLPQVLPPLTSTAVNAACDRLSKLTEPTASLALAATLVEVATPSEVAKIGRSLKWTNKEIERAGWLVEHRRGLDGAASRKWSEIQPLLAADGGAELVALRGADRGANGEDSDQRFCEERLALPPERLNPFPLVLGADLIAAGQKPGPAFAGLLAQARAAQLDRLVSTKAEALQLLGLEE